MRAAILLLLMFTSLEPMTPQQNAMTQQNAAPPELRALMAERVRASVAGDTEIIVRSMTDDYMQTDISGYVQDKAAWLKEYFVPLAALIHAGKFHWERYEQQDLKFRMFGDTAVVMGQLSLKGIGAKWASQLHTWQADPNASFSGTLHFTHIYIKRDGRWQLAALQNAVSPLPA